jgi:hypothetical protein
MITLLATATLYPYSLTDWIGGLLAHPKLGPSPADTGRFLYYFLLNPSQFMQGLWIPAALYSIYLLASQNRKWWIVGITILSSIMFWYTALRIPSRSYNLFMFIPFFVWISMLAVNRLEYARRRKVICILVMVVGVFAIAILGRRYIVLQHSLFEGTRPQALVEEVKSIPMDQKIAMDQSLIITCFYPHEWERFVRVERWVDVDSDTCEGWDYIIIKQSSSARQAPPQKNGYHLISNNFRRSSIYIGPIRIANTDSSYNYAIYRRIPEK